MTIYRNPVEGARLPYPLACVDIDPTTGLRVGPEPKCWKLQEKHPVSQRRPYFQCPNIGSKTPGRCDTHTFLYPRRWTKGGAYYHVHQGIDIFATKGTPIRSVTAGKVYAASKTFLKRRARDLRAAHRQGARGRGRRVGHRHRQRRRADARGRRAAGLKPPRRRRRPHHFLRRPRLVQLSTSSASKRSFTARPFAQESDPWLSRALEHRLRPSRSRSARGTPGRHRRTGGDPSSAARRPRRR